MSRRMPTNARGVGRDELRLVLEALYFSWVVPLFRSCQMDKRALTEYVMRALVALLALATFAAVPLGRAADTTTSPTPQASASPGKKHSKKSATTATSTAGTNSTASASPTKPAKGVPAPQAVQAAGGGAGKVWVNTETHVYHKEGSKWYGRTKNGKYLSEQDAIKEGDKPAKNEK
jgi:hypothetical protein